MIHISLSAVGILTLVAFWFIFSKFGEPGWKAVIPFYNTYIWYKYTWGNGWYFLFLLVPIANIVFYILTMIKTAKAFGHNEGFAVGLIFLPPVFLLILALNEDRYLGYPVN